MLCKRVRDRHFRLRQIDPENEFRRILNYEEKNQIIYNSFVIRHIVVDMHQIMFLIELNLF